VYVGSALKDGAFKCGPGSLGDVLPESFRALFVRAAADPAAPADWTAESGRRYRFSNISARFT
jgi:hypothetical protein